jgi:2-iminobutanoate/2-iminopropanoate deaminase
MKSIFALAAASLMLTALHAAEPVAKCDACHRVIDRIATENAPAALGAYSQAVSVDLSKTKRMLFVAGQVAIDPETGALLENDIQTATKQTLDNIEAILTEAGTSWNFVVRMDVFLRDFNDWDGMNAVYAERFVDGVYPARQTVGVDMENLVEISCIAVVPY